MSNGRKETDRFDLSRIARPHAEHAGPLTRRTFAMVLAGGRGARLKQLLRHWTAGGLVPDAESRFALLRERDADALIARFRGLADAA